MFWKLSDVLIETLNIFGAFQVSLMRLWNRSFGCWEVVAHMDTSEHSSLHPCRSVTVCFHSLVDIAGIVPAGEMEVGQRHRKGSHSELVDQLPLRSRSGTTLVSCTT